MINTKGSKMKRLGFTMIEVVLVIVVLGILAAVAIPRIDRDIKQEAADNILSSIRYTQHLALTDNKHRHDRNDWQKALWQINFLQSSGNWSYTIGTDMNYDGSLATTEAAIDPSNGQLMHSSATNPSPNILLTKKYGINSITFNNCGSSGIAFDNLGRPHGGVSSATNDLTTYLSNDCQITFVSSIFDSNLSIEIKKETGYAYIIGQPNS